MNIAYLSRQVEALTKRVETLEEIVHQKRNQAAAPSPALARKELKDFRDKETP